MKEAKYFVSLKTKIVVDEEYNVMVSSAELFGTAEYLSL